ncbi:MAG: hypothetical protein V2J65_11465 [Desulfobacteraceae bacterium]|nr:hypothetical protein [Desulfobacteraceae bacterium]
MAPNVGKTGALPFKMVSSKLETDVPVVARGGCVRRVADVESNGRLTNEAKLAALQHLYFRFLLGIGDSGTHQILIREDFKTSGRLITVHKHRPAQPFEYSGIWKLLGLDGWTVFFRDTFFFRPS